MDTPTPPTLGAALASQWASADTAACLLAIVAQTVMFLHSNSTWERLMEFCHIALEGALLVVSVGGCSRRQRRYRTPLAVAARLSIMLLEPWMVDAVLMLQPPAALAMAPAEAAGCSGGSAGGSAWRALASLGSTIRAAVLLALPVSWLHGCLGTAMGFQLPPVLHATLHAFAVAALLLRTPAGGDAPACLSACLAAQSAGLPCAALQRMQHAAYQPPLPSPAACRQYVAGHPSNGRVAAAAYWLLQQAASLLCLGSREHLKQVSASKSDCEKCTAVAWALQVGGMPSALHPQCAAVAAFSRLSTGACRLQHACTFARLKQ
jgi:hypothetical protein